MFYNLALAATESTGDKLSIGEAGITAIFGYCVVFFGLIILMAVLYGTGAYFKSKDAKKAAAPVVEEKELAPGSAGHVKLYDVPDKEAAMIMAIVADKMKKPLNELRFISIKEVK